MLAKGTCTVIQHSKGGRGRGVTNAGPALQSLRRKLFSALSDRLALKGLCPVRGLSWKGAGKEFFLPGGCKKE